MKAYIAVSYKKRKELSAEIETIKNTLAAQGMKAVVFANEFTFTVEAGKTCLPAGREMMQQAMLSIDECDLLIAETTDKAIGIGIEAGYAKAKGKKIIYLRRKNAEHSTTLAGISDFQIVYDGLVDLKSQLNDVFSKTRAAE